MNAAPRSRRTPTTVLRDRKALLFAKAYPDRFRDWQRRAAFISAAAMRALSQEDRAQQQAELTTLIIEVEAAHAEFARAAAGQPQHNRIDDVSFAFERLLTILRQARS